ncbi:MAG: response regulator transcription factor [Sporomusaceae bacterium]|nr:response regulator transcription factor [Sporomusaceae bacterium]
MIKILIADDEPSIVEVVKLYLLQENFEVYCAYDGTTALEMEEQYKPDLLLLDIMLPGYSGLEICQAITRDVPVIFLTAKTAEQDKITGFSLGADDYITKPFSPKELIARVKAVLRRSNLLFAESILTFPGLTINPTSHVVKSNEQTVALSPKEYELLLFLVRHPSQVFDRDQVLTNVWGYDFDGDDRTVDATVKRLRHKLAEPAANYIHTVWGKGYKFEVPES